MLREETNTEKEEQSREYTIQTKTRTSNNKGDRFNTKMMEIKLTVLSSRYMVFDRKSIPIVA